MARQRERSRLREMLIGVGPADLRDLRKDEEVSALCGKWEEEVSEFLLKSNVPATTSLVLLIADAEIRLGPGQTSICSDVAASHSGIQRVPTQLSTTLELR